MFNLLFDNAVIFNKFSFIWLDLKNDFTNDRDCTMVSCYCLLDHVSFKTNFRASDLLYRIKSIRLFIRKPVAI